jgi:CheY-like chemotaxis protein
MKYRKGILSSVSFMKSTLNSLVATYQILLMTINRCTDYTKISHKIPLLPTLATINLVETVTATISCVKELQRRVTVELIVDPSVTNEHIITDRQWLQDNLLCLVSNAVKYSGEGTLTTVKVLVGYKQDVSNPPSVENVGEDGEEVRLVREAPKTRRLMLRFEVEDNGIGLKLPDPHSSIEEGSTTDEEMRMKKIFQEPDFMIRKELGGSGLGLHCLAKRVEALRGEYGITGRQDEKHGALFWFSIPYTPALTGSVDPDTSRIDPYSSPPAPPVGKHWFESKDLEVKKNISSMSAVSQPGDGRGPDDGGKTLSEKKVSFSLQEPSEASSKVTVPRELGNTFTKDDAMCSSYSIPCSNVPSSKTESSLLSSVPVVVSPIPEKPRLLVVDDSLPILKMLKMMLEKNGYDVITAVNGLEALQYFQNSIEETLSSKQQQLPVISTKSGRHIIPVFDGILMDIQMPVMGGIESISKIREHEKNSHPDALLLRHHLIVAMSAGNDDETLAAVYTAGADDFLAKPFNLQAFKKILQEHRRKEHLKADGIN